MKIDRVEPVARKPAPSSETESARAPDEDLDRRINETLAQLIRAEVPYDAVHNALWRDDKRTKEDILECLRQLLPLNTI